MLNAKEARKQLGFANGLRRTPGNFIDIKVKGGPAFGRSFFKSLCFSLSFLLIFHGFLRKVIFGLNTWRLPGAHCSPGQNRTSGRLFEVNMKRDWSEIGVVANGKIYFSRSFIVTTNVCLRKLRCFRGGVRLSLSGKNCRPLNMLSHASTGEKCF